LVEETKVEVVKTKEGIKEKNGRVDEKKIELQ
jgi:hypothetical protein